MLKLYGTTLRFGLLSGAIIVLAVQVLSLSIVRADDVPSTAGDFAAYCTPLNEGCRTKINVVQVATTIQAMTSSPPTTACTVPKGIEHEEADKAIVGWLSARPNAAGMSTEDGINAAIKALWNCQESVATGVTSLGVPDETGAFVTFCANSQHYAKCANQIVQASVNAAAARTFNGTSPHCIVPSDVKDNDATAKVLAWLQEHGEVYSQTTEEGTATAVDHLWPCH